MASKSKDASAAPLFKPDDDSKRAVSALTSAGAGAAKQVAEQEVTRRTSVALTQASVASIPTEVITLAQCFVEKCVRTIVRQEWSIVDAVPALVALGLDEGCGREIAAAAHGKRAALAAAYRDSAPSYPGLSSLRWRLDVTISSSSVNRVMRPVLLIELTTDDGHVHAFEVPTDKFHELRYNTAKVLMEMGAVEGHPVLRIQ